MRAEPGEESKARLYFFDPAVKCCSYVPELHNFLVGQLLADTDPAAQPGRATVDARIAGGVGVTPLGLMPPPEFSLLYGNSDDSFGRSRTLRCPHYLEDTGRCGVWRHRDSTCVTWFCKHVRGSLGYAFWRDGLHRLLQVVERDLSRWCILEIGVSDDALQRVVATGGWTGVPDTVTGDSLDSRVTRDAYAELWGEWREREREFFGRCADLVTPLAWNDVLAICGPEARAFARLTEQAYRRLMAEDIPPVLTVAPVHLVQIQRGMARINTYSEYDPLDVPMAVMEALPYFDGRPTGDALTAIEHDLGTRLEPALVQKMVDFALLVRPK